jgi:glycosyltransferase involved in cell wall biosynthesis
MKTAVYTVALNEAKHVNRWADATQDADYTLVADAGSTDDTPAMLRRRGVRVEAITVSPWRFDMARNAALAMLPPSVDICVALDMDEVCEPDLFDKLRHEWDTNGSFHRANVFIDVGGRFQLNGRIHYRHNYRWVSPIHEVIVPYYSFLQRIVDIDSTIYHRPDDTKSRGQYLGLLEMAVAETPDDGRMWVYLCRERYFRGDKAGVLEAAKKAIALPNLTGDVSAVCHWAAWASAYPNEWDIRARLYGEPSPWHPVPTTDGE